MRNKKESKHPLHSKLKKYCIDTIDYGAFYPCAHGEHRKLEAKVNPKFTQMS